MRSDCIAPRREYCLDQSRLAWLPDKAPISFLNNVINADQVPPIALDDNAIHSAPLSNSERDSDLPQ